MGRGWRAKDRGSGVPGPKSRPPGDLGLKDGCFPRPSVLKYEMQLATTRPRCPQSRPRAPGRHTAEGAGTGSGRASLQLTGHRTPPQRRAPSDVETRNKQMSCVPPLLSTEKTYPLKMSGATFTEALQSDGPGCRTAGSVPCACAHRTGRSGRARPLPPRSAVAEKGGQAGGAMGASSSGARGPSLGHMPHRVPPARGTASQDRPRVRPSGAERALPPSSPGDGGRCHRLRPLGGVRVGGKERQSGRPHGPRCPGTSPRAVTNVSLAGQSATFPL